MTNSMMKTNYLFIGMAAIMKMNRKWMTDV